MAFFKDNSAVPIDKLVMKFRSNYTTSYRHLQQLEKITKHKKMCAFGSV